MKWFLSQQDSILAGIVSSAIVLIAQIGVGVLIRVLSDAVLHRSLCRRIWGFRKPKRIYLVSGSVDALADGETAFLSGPSADAAALIRVSLSMLYPGVEVIQTYAPTMSHDLYGSNIVTVGGPINNRVTRDFLSDELGGLRFQGLNLVGKQAEYQLGSNDPAVGRVDYALIVNRPSLFNREARWIVVAGCDSGGVLAGAEALSPVNQARKVQLGVRRSWRLRWKRMKDPSYAILETMSKGNIASYPTLVEAGVIK